MRAYIRWQMPVWKRSITIKHLLVRAENAADYKDLRKSMRTIGLILKAEIPDFDSNDFFRLPKGDHIMKPVDYANKLLERMYDYCDRERIWVK